MKLGIPTCGPAGRRQRRGAVHSMGLILVLPILMMVVLGIIEFGLLLLANHHVEVASQQGCRAATFPLAADESLERVVRDAVERSLARSDLIRSYRLRIEGARYTGDPVLVEVSVPMADAAPDLLSWIGFNLKGRRLISHTVMRKE